jgi:peptidoglycan hydrolase-like protein with peptidoglycan-binding domain
MRRGRIAAGGVAAAGALVVASVLLTAGDNNHAARAASSGLPTAAVERRDLVARDNVSGTLGYADAGSLSGAAAGVITRLPAEGSVIARGHSLYDVDDEHAAFLLYGALPAWRDFAPGMDDGADVRQLERNLRALGYDTGHVDDHWTYLTTDAVERFQNDRGLDETGTLTRAQVVFRPGATRIGQESAAVGDQSGPGRAIAQLSSTQRVVTVKLDATRQGIARVGERVTVEMPTGGTADGRITDVGTVATKAGQDSDPTIDVTVHLRGRAARGTRLDQAPVDVGFAVEQRHDVLAVPIKALLARQGGGYAVETPDRRLVSVEPGLYADDWVEVTGAGLHEGMRVVTAE